MILAFILLSCIAVAVIAATAVKRSVLYAWLAVPLATLVPLGGWLFLQLTAEPARSPLEFEVLGQYHRLSDTIRVSTQPDADVVLRGTADADLHVAWNAAAQQLHVRVTQAAAPIVIGRQPVNAVPLGRRTSITSASGTTREIVRPWFCWRCDARYVQSPGGAERSEIRLDASPRVIVGTDTVRVFRLRGIAYVAADPRSGIRVNDEPIPATTLVPADTLFIGWPATERLELRALAAQHRLEVRFAQSSGRRWVLPAAEGDTLRLLVSATNAEPLPGTMAVINPAMAAPGAAAQPYGGVLSMRDGVWSWLSNGVTRPFVTGEPQLLPGMQHERAAGHIVRVRQYDTDPAAARWAVISAWFAGGIALTLLWRYLHPAALALRVLLMGTVYTLIAARATFAFRAWLAPPYDANSPQTLLALLIAVPALAAALHIWTQQSTGRLPRGQVRREVALVTAPLLLAAVAVAALVLPGWRMTILGTVAACIIIAPAGLILLNRVLMGGRAVGRGFGEPLAAVTAQPQPGYTHRQFLSALILLAMLGFLLLVINQLLRYGALLAVVAWGTMLGGALLATSGPRVLIRARSSGPPLLLGAAAGAAAGLIAWLLGLGPLVAALALVAAGAVAYAMRARATLTIRSIHLRDLAGPPLLLGIAVSLVAALLPGFVRSTRVVAEYALAIAGLIAIARIFTILWFRHTHQLIQHPHERRQRKRLPGLISIAGVVLLLLGMVYVPLAAFDTGLVLLFFAATTTAVFLGFYMIGARVIAALVPLAVGVAFFLGMFVRPADLVDGSASLNTAQIRYAATYHPQQLQRHMLTTDDGRPVTSVRTLQQYWGIRHYAASGVTGRGYFNAAYADWIVPRPVALTENVFSTFVLSEHGWIGGSAVLFCYLVLALALLYGAARSVGGSGTAPRSLLLVGIAAFWIVPAFYIAAANGLLLPLTGQNMPMLGLLSSADVALAGWLTAIGLTALPSDGGLEHVRSGGWTSRLRAGIAIVAVTFTLAAVALMALLWRPAQAEVGDFTLDSVVADVESLVEQGAVRVMPASAGPDTIGIAASAATHPLLPVNGFVRARIHRANAIARGEAPGAGCLDADPLLRLRVDHTIGVFGALCALRAVVESRQDWTGALAADVAQSEFVLSDGRTAIVLDPLHDAEAVLGGACAPVGTTRARLIRIGCGTGRALVRFGTSAPVLEQLGTNAELNGAAARAPTLLRHGDHVRVEASADVWTLEVPRSALAYARWENGASRRIMNTPVTPWLAQVDTQLARGLAHPERVTWNAEVTLQPALHRQLQTALTAACAAVPGVRRCSALLADPFTGEIMALAATSTQPHRYLSADPNLRNHPAASAIKPIIATAALQAYPELRTLEVDHSAAEYSTIANTAVQPALRAGRLYPAPRVPWRGYLGASDNLYAATLGFLATSAPATDRSLALRGSHDASQLRLNGRPLRGQPSWAATNGRMDLSASPLATALRTLYGVHVHSADTPPYDVAFWDAAVSAGALVSSGTIQRITPEPVSLDMNGIRSARELAAFMIGGDRNRWNNVALVQALSRIYSGRAVDLHLLRSVGPHQLTRPAGTFASSETSRRAVLDGMAAVTDEPWGTAYPLRSTFPPRVTWRAKTGTLLEREWVGSVFLFAGGSDDANAAACAAAGVVTVELNGNGTPEGRATAVFRDAIAPLLKQNLGWGTDKCPRPDE